MSVLPSAPKSTLVSFGESNAVYGYLLDRRCGKIEQSYDEHYTDKSENRYLFLPI